MSTYVFMWLAGIFSWQVFAEDFSATSLLMGTCISTFAIWLFNLIHLGHDEGSKISFYALIRFTPWYFVQVIKSGVRLAIMVCLPNPSIEEEFIDYQVELSCMNQITVLSNLITLTPGTLSINFDQQTRVLKIHCLKYSKFFAAIDPVADIKDLEQRLKGVFCCL